MPKLEAETLVDLINSTPEPPWLIRGVMPENSLILVTGKGHTSKTFLALEAGIAIASGTKWLEKFETGQPVRVLYIGEDNSRSQTVKQARKLLMGRGMDLHDLSDRMLFCVTQGANLTTEQHAAKIADLIFRYEPRMVVLDSLRFLSPGADEDSSTEMGAIMDRVKGLRDLPDVEPAIMLIHHEGKSGGGSPRGSGVIFDGVDGHLALRFNKRSETVHVEVMKRRVIDVLDWSYQLEWDLERARLVAVEDAPNPDEGVILQFLTERPTAKTADLIAVVAAQSEGMKPATAKSKAMRALGRLEVAKQVRRVSQGIYCKANVNPL